MELTALQKHILAAPEDKIAIQAAAAALKTTTLTEKVRQLLRNGEDPSRIAVITFTRMAAAELIERLGEDYKDGIFVGTIHALAAHFLARYGLGANIKKVAEDNEFDELFELCKDLDLTGYFDICFVDEAQDTGTSELDFIFNLLQPKRYFIVFDIRQSIYGFKGAKPALLMKYLNSTGAKFYSLNENYRNGSQILQFAKRIISKIIPDDSVASCGKTGQVVECNWTEDILQQIITDGDYKSWAILTRTNKDLDYLQMILRAHKVPFNTFKQGDITKAQLEKMMNENKVKLLTIHSSKGLGFDKVVVYNPQWWGQDITQINYVAATRARDLLIWAKVGKKKW